LRSIILLLLLLNLSLAEDLSSAKVARLIKKGAKIATKLCDQKQLVDLLGTPKEIEQHLTKSKPCGDLNTKHQHALAYYLANRQEHNQTTSHIDVPTDAKCPVCGMFVHKYPKWSAEMIIKGRQYYFDGVKDMMKYYIFDGDFPYNRSDITQINVNDFYTLKAIDAHMAYYVIGADLFGPMGDELIPFESREEADNFMRDHNGKRILRFKEIDAQVIMQLDGHSL